SLALATTAKKKAEEVAVLVKEQQRVKPFVQKLKDSPDDAEANGEVGKYLCLARGLWQKGLPLLARGKDQKLKELAQKDLARPKATKAKVTLGNAWWELAEKEKPPAQHRLQERAAFWYEKALPDLTGLSRTRLEKRLETVAPRPQGEIRWT